MRKVLARFIREDEGQNLVEYALLGALVALVALTTLKTIGTNLSTVFTNIGNQLK